jgi:eIF4-gamma/eIF5/eIF2-epsilon
MAEEEREKLRVHREERGPPPVVNSRFAAVAEADRSSSNNDDRVGGGSSFNNKNNEDRGPPPVANSRFAAAAEADRSSSRTDYNNDRGPPPIANSRFAAAAEADGGRSSYGDRDRDRDRGPPLVANSRFAAVAETDRSSSYNNDRDRGSSSYQNDRDRGPPPVTNSRFAAAADADRDYTSRSDRPSRDNDRPRNNDDNRDRSRFTDNRGPPPVANSRFASAAAMSKEDDREREESRRDRYGSRDRFDGARSRFDPRYVEEPEAEVDNSRMEELLQRTMKKKDQEVVLDSKAKEHEANMFQIPAKALVKEEDDFLSDRKKVKEAQQAAEPAKEEKPKEEKVSIAEVSADTTEEVMRAFVHSGLLGNDLKAWCDGKRLVLPTVEKLLKYFLIEHEKLNPDPNCAWAERNQYGAALVSIVDDDLFKQMQVLWAIQEYCDGLGFPLYNNESVVQSMFRSMYKYDLAEGQAFKEWKEDESEMHEKGKMTAIMQTVDWFNWLEEDDDEEDEEY